MKTKLITLSFLLLFSTNTFAQDTGLTNYVDPRIGSEGLGRVFIGPSCPYGMVKPSPDCTPRPNSGWLPMPGTGGRLLPEAYVSGTGGGPKYGKHPCNAFLATEWTVSTTSTIARTKQ
ncbi:MAG: hypothetical protein ACLUE2_15470 [Bacteroides cellulosilyticus]